MSCLFSFIPMLVSYCLRLDALHCLNRRKGRPIWKRTSFSRSDDFLPDWGSHAPNGAKFVLRYTHQRARRALNESVLHQTREETFDLRSNARSEIGRPICVCFCYEHTHARTCTHTYTTTRTRTHTHTHTYTYTCTHMWRWAYAP